MIAAIYACKSTDQTISSSGSAAVTATKRKRSAQRSLTATKRAKPSPRGLPMRGSSTRKENKARGV